MSTNKTENLSLHRWEPNDRVLREEFNENWEAIDENAGATWEQVMANAAALAGQLRFTSGSYTGDGTTGREITVGFRPKLLLLQGRVQDNTRGCLMVRGENFDVTVRDSGNVFHDQRFVTGFTDTGFVISNYNFNLVNYTSHYIAIG